MLHTTPTDPSAPRSLTPFELTRIEALAAALLPRWFYDMAKVDTGAVYATIEDPRGDGGFVIEGDQRGGVSVSDPSLDVVTNVSLEGAVVAIREAIGVPVG